MTAPLGFRTVYPQTTGSQTVTSRSALPGLPRPQPRNVVDTLTQSITPDHLSLIKALVKAGKYSRALELLDAAHQLDADHEQCWYLRLWALTGEGKEGEALHLVRTVAPRLPGSAAIAYLQAALECGQQDGGAALESALRSRAAAPGRAEPEALLQPLLSAQPDAGDAAIPGRVPESPIPLLRPQGFSVLAAALQGAALLHPAGSSRARIPLLPPRIRQPDPKASPTTPPWRRFGVLALAIVIAALWAIPDPVPAAIALAVVVVLVTRNPSGTPIAR